MSLMVSLETISRLLLVSFRVLGDSATDTTRRVWRVASVGNRLKEPFGLLGDRSKVSLGLLSSARGGPQRTQRAECPVLHPLGIVFRSLGDRFKVPSGLLSGPRELPQRTQHAECHALHPLGTVFRSRGDLFKVPFGFVSGPRELPQRTQHVECQVLHP